MSLRSRSGSESVEPSMGTRPPWRSRFTVLLPVLGPQLSRCWGRLSSIAELQERAPGRPPEPRGAVLPAEAVGEVQALIVPALAVDRGGRRLGQGGGWYDRMLPLRGEGVQVFAMVHHDELVAGPLPQEPHDMPVDAVINAPRWPWNAHPPGPARRCGRRTGSVRPRRPGKKL